MKFWHKKSKLLLSGLLLVLVLGLGTMVYAINAGPPTTAETEPPAKKVVEVPVVGTTEKLEELLSQSASVQLYGKVHRGMIMEEEKSVSFDSLANQAAPATGSSSKTLSDYSGTNIQVKGVDEADIVKTDGHYIYVLNRNRLSIVKALPADKMELVAKIEYKDDFNPRDLYVDAEHLIVIGDGYRDNPQIDYKLKENLIRSPYHFPQTGKAIIYNIADKSAPVIAREIEVEGYTLATRKIGSSLYLVTNRNAGYSPGEPIILPTYRDSAAQADFESVTCDKINYFPDCSYDSYIIVAAVNTDNLEQKVDIKTYLGNGQNIYASPSNLFIAVHNYPAVQPLLQDSAFPETASEITTDIYRFALEGASTVCTGKGTVPGTILNQFSMDESQGYFRIATTTGDMWSSGDNTSKNHVYVLDGDLKVTGKLEDIAPGEKIYSTRFMGERAYMVTFRTVDPLFVIDLKNPQEPKILGKLKIPGYSDYLHPYDANHIIGFGKDTVEIKNEGEEPQAFYKGLKVAIFDVTDVSQPRQMSEVIIGDRGTESEVLHNHKALLFDRDRNLMAFPVTLMELDKNTVDKPGQIPAYGSFSFQGAYIFNVDLNKGLQFKGRISHLQPDDYQRAGDYWYQSDKNVNRILYIGNVLYTVSPSKIMTNAIASLKEISQLEF